MTIPKTGLNESEGEKREAGATASRLLLSDQKKGQVNFTMKDVLKEEMDMNSKLFSLSEEVFHRYERVDALGGLIDTTLNAFHENGFNDDQIENIRILLDDCFGRERNSLKQIEEELKDIADFIPAETETESEDSQCEDVYKAIEEVPVADHEMNRDEIRQIMDKAWKPSQDADGVFNAIVDAYNYGFSQGYKTGLAEKETV